MDRIRVQLGKSPRNLFNREFDGKDARSIFSMVIDYLKFYYDYRDKHDISARRWEFPYVFLNGKQTSFNVGPNGNWWDDEKNDCILWKLDFANGQKKVWLNFVQSIQSKIED